MARHDESELTLINERNIHALHEAIKDDRVKIAQANEKADNALRTVATLQTEIANLRVQLATILNMR